MRLHQQMLYVSLMLAILPAAKASAEGCPNEALRAAVHSAALTDCRGYELVSPSAKNGWSASVLNISPDGAHVLASSLGGFAEGNQSTITSLYSITRTPDGWITAPFTESAGFLNPHLENIQAANLDLTKGIFEYRLLAGQDPREQAFYVRNLPDGSPEEIGPVYSSAVVASNPAVVQPAASEPSASKDLTRVTFELEGPGSLAGAPANYLWPGDSTVENPGAQAFVSLYEYGSKGSLAPSLVGVNAHGQISQCGTSLGYPSEGVFTRFQGDELYNAISATGSRAYFTAAADCGVGSGPPANELFARIRGEKTVPISEPEYPLSQGSGAGPEECNATCEAQAPEGAVFQGASEDGSKVFFLTRQPLLNGDEDAEIDLYEAELEGSGVATRIKKLIQVSHNPGIGQSADVQGVARISEDGSHVYFVAKGVLVSAPDSAGRMAQMGSDNLYVYERDSSYPNGHMAFIGTLSAADAEDWQPEDARPVDATPDGRFLVFTSSADLTPDDTSSVAQAFEYDAQEGTLTRVSIGQDGFNRNGNTDESQTSVAYPRYRGSLNPALQPSSVSDDGAYVVFQSKDSLTPQAAQGYNNVYEYHAGRVSLVSDGQDRTSSVFLVGIDPTGKDIFFTTADRLVSQDGDTQEDIYDARIDGGFLPPSSTGCQGDGCQGALSAVPSLPLPASASQPAGEQVLESPPKPVAGAKSKTGKVKHHRRARRARHKAGRRAQRGRH